jgi:hypothetical protein
VLPPASLGLNEVLLVFLILSLFGLRIVLLVAELQEFLLEL